jgi:iron-sulfur cluster repair protein YtfE (RIC family)
MLSIGSRHAPQDLVDLLLDCHARIREFTSLARRLAEARQPPVDEVRDAASRVRRYFVEALPLHARDEEESLVPRLRGRDPALDRELEEMLGEHVAHGEILDRVVELCGALVEAPGRHAELAPALGSAAAALERHFDEHLGREERAIFPAVRALPDHERAVAVAELRARRS